MAELADAPDLGSGVFDVQVQVLLSAVKKKAKVIKTFVFFLGRIASWNLSVQGLRSAPVGARPMSPGHRAPCYPQQIRPIVLIRKVFEWSVLFLNIESSPNYVIIS